MVAVAERTIQSQTTILDRTKHWADLEAALAASTDPLDRLLLARLRYWSPDGCGSGIERQIDPETF